MTKEVPLKVVSVATSVIVMGIGVLVLAGWHFDVGWLKSVLPGLVAMKANTALGLLLSGLGLLLLGGKEEDVMKRTWIGLIAVAVAALGGVTLAEYFFGWNPGLDQWMYQETGATVWTSEPGRMAPVTAFCFVLMGGALLAGSQRVPVRMRVPVLAGVGTALLVIGGLAMLGSCAEVLLHKPEWNNSGLALHTAGAFLLLGAGLLAVAVSRRGLRWSLDRNVTWGFVVALAVMLFAAGVSINLTRQLQQTGALVAHRQEVLRAISDVQEAVAGVMAVQRDYVTLGDPTSLGGLKQAETLLQATLDNVKNLTADNTRQLLRMDQLEPLINQRVAFTELTIDTNREQGKDAAQKLIATGKGITMTIAINRLIKEMQTAEYTLLDSDRARAQEASTQTFLILPVGVFLSLAISALGMFFLNEDVRERMRMEKGWKLSEERFQTVIENLTEGLIIADLKGNLLHWNPAALEMHGFKPGEDGEWSLKFAEQVFVLSTLEGKPVPPREWPMSRVIRGEQLRDVPRRVKRLDREFERVFSYAGSIVTEPDGGELAFLTMFDITERTRVDEALRESERQLWSFVAQAPVAMAMLDRNMVYLATSGRWSETFGKGKGELVGKSHYEVMTDIPQEWRHAHREAMEGISHRKDEDLWVQADGTRRWLRWAVQPWRDARGEIGGVMILKEDISDRKRAEEVQMENVRLEAENRKVAEASRMKSEFLANMSHELRTPLNGIIGFSELLSDERPGPLNRKQKEYLGDVLNSANHLLQLINDVLDLAKVEAGKFDFQPEPFLLAQAIEETCAVVRGMANKKQIVLGTHIDPAVGTVRLDEHRFKQICYNLLSNAVKFTDAGGKVEIAAGPGENGFFEVRVTDTGIGIKEGDMERLFREFEQLESGAARRFEGTGLGLALTKKLVEMQGGNVSATSEYGKGSTFTVVLPRDAEGGVIFGLFAEVHKAG
jgi:PAS domain S-box-containing protein